MSWIANILIWVGLWRIGYKDRRAFVLLMAGDLIWVALSVYNWTPDVIASFGVFFFFSARNWWKWR